jgi:hypothetical protein
VFGIGYSLGLGLLFGLAWGIANGITLAIEFSGAACGLDHYSLTWEAFFSAIRGFGFRGWTLPERGLEIRTGFCRSGHTRPDLCLISGHAPGHRLQRRLSAPRLTRRQFWGTVVRTLGFMATSLICSAFIRHLDHAWTFALRIGLVTGAVTGIGATVNPFIEYYADSLPERRLGAFGIGLILCGFWFAIAAVLAGAF